MKYKREVGLEKLRDDLDLFLRVLKSSMVELINRDFADFLKKPLKVAISISP